MRLPQSTRSRDLAQDQSGMVLLFWAFSMLGLLGFMAIVADTGLASMERRELQNTADAAAMAGAQDLLLTGGGAEAGAESFAAPCIADSSATKRSCRTSASPPTSAPMPNRCWTKAAR